MWEANARQLHPQRTTEVRAWGSGGPARYALMEREPQGGDEDGVGARPCRRLCVSWEKLLKSASVDQLI